MARNGAAGAPGETATATTSTIARATLGEAEVIGNGPAEIGEITTGIGGGPRVKMPTGTVDMSMARAGERTVNCLQTSCMMR